MLRTAPQQALTFVADIAAKIAWIAEVGFTGSPRDHVSEGLRALPYRRRCIYYRVFDDHVVIVRVLHGAQDIEQQHFKSPYSAAHPIGCAKVAVAL